MIIEKEENKWTIRSWPLCIGMVVFFLLSAGIVCGQGLL